MTDTVQLAEIRQAVEARLAVEAETLAPVSKDTTLGGPDDPRFVMQCLENNERGDGILAAALYRGQFVYVKSRDEKSKAWFRFNGVHWEVDKADAHMIIPEGVALCYQRTADMLRPDIAKSRDAADTAREKTASLAKELKRLIREDASAEAIATTESDHRAATEELSHATRQYKKQTQLMKDYSDRIDRLRALRGAKNCLEYSHKIGAEGLYIFGDEVDQKPNLLPAKNCVIDLETGAALKGNPADYLVRALPHTYTPGAASPHFDKFIADIHEDNAEKIAFVMRWWGYCLTGHVTEQQYTMFSGDGANGKGTMLEIMQEIFGELAKQIMAEMLVKTKTARSSTGASPDILALQGRRWVFVDETNEGDAVNEAELKRTTGGNRRSGRGLFDKFDTEFRPTHKLSVVTNHPWKGIAATYSLKRRLIFLHYRLRYDPNPEESARNDPGNAPYYRPIDKNLDQKLRSELEGILCRLVEGAMQWYQTGLAVPQCLLDAVEEVKANEDTLGQFLTARGRFDPAYQMIAKEFLDAYQKWYIEEGHNERWKPQRNTTYTQLRAKGFSIPSNRTTGGTTMIIGLDIHAW
jgi:putative DNA primase/helicase